MRIISYSDLHLEFGSNFILPSETAANVLILAGDIITFKNYHPLAQLLDVWRKPVLYVTGNHEYYTRQPMDEENSKFRTWLASKYPNVTLLLDEAVTISDVNFFGGTMWTNFANGNAAAMITAQQQMNDYNFIATSNKHLLNPADTIQLHEAFTKKLLIWFQEDLSGERVVITHHAPVVNPDTQYGTSPLMPAFNSLDMLPIIEKYQPRLWVYGHTHECDNHMIGRTQIISNQLGYPKRDGSFECKGFDKTGLPIVF